MDGKSKHVPGALALLCALGSPASAQSWLDAGQPSPLYASTVILTDTVHDMMYAGGGDFVHATANTGHFLLYRYNGLVWDTIGYFGNVLETAVMYRDTLVVGGAFKWMREDTIKRVACYANGAWHPYGDLGSEFDGGAVRSLRVINDTLYAVGTFRFADGLLCRGLAKRVGGHWECLGPPLPYTFDPIFNDIIKFQGKLVVSGIFCIAQPHFCRVMQLESDGWQPVCNGCMMGGMDDGGRMAVYKDELYLGGRSYYGSGNPGQGGMRWNGQQWRSIGEVGAGLQQDFNSDAYPPRINNFLVHNDLLFIVGTFRYAGLMPAVGIANWDGERFCVLGGPMLPLFNGGRNLAFYHDSLYLYFELGNGLSRYQHTTFDHMCGSAGIAGQSVQNGPLRAAWTPADGLLLHGLADGTHQLRIFDAQGRLVLERSLQSTAGRSMPVAFAGRPQAVYVAVVDGRHIGRFIPVR